MMKKKQSISTSYNNNDDDDAMAGVAQWTECQSENQKVTGLFPVRAHVWVVGQVLSRGASERQPHMDVSLPLSLPSPL